MQLSLSKKECRSLKKTCTKCKVEKALADFYRNRHTYHSSCKQCHREYAVLRRQGMSEEEKKSASEYYKKYSLEWRKKNKNHILKKTRKWRDDNREQLRKYWRDRYHLKKNKVG